MSLKRIPVKNLKPIQSEVKREKVEKLKKNEHLLSNPIIVSRGGFVLDGHHRWLAALELDPESRILALVCDCPIGKLVGLGHEFDGSFTRTVHEHAIYTDTLENDDTRLMVRKTLRPVY